MEITETSAIRATCPSASAPLPSTFPASSARTGTAATRISTIRVCFSSVTLWAIWMPKVIDAKKKIIPKAIGTMKATIGLTASGSSSWTGGELLSALMTESG
jgi:hypothetical protein